MEEQVMTYGLATLLTYTTLKYIKENLKSFSITSEDCSILEKAFLAGDFIAVETLIREKLDPLKNIPDFSELGILRGIYED